MAEEILINSTPYETRAAIVFSGSLQELHVEREVTRGLVGNVYLGKVSRVIPGMQSAFIEVGLERTAFLHVADLWSPAPTHPAESAPSIPIEKRLFAGQSILVQVIKDPIGTKGARLSTQISIAGRLLVYLPQEPHIGISQKIANEKDRAMLRDRVQRLAGENERGGYIVRTNAEEASDEEFAADIAYLRLRWQQILECSKTKPPPSVAYQELSLAQRSLRDLAHEGTLRVLVDSKTEFAALQAFAATYMPALSHKLEWHATERPLFDLHSIEDEIGRALARRVDLKSGGYLIIDQTEALTTIDVNTGGFVGGRNFDDTIFRTNLEATHAIARQLRLRNLGGIIIADFIDMHSTEHRDAVADELRKSLAKDRNRASVSGFTSLGLVEITRKRTRESLAHMLCEPCPTCEGRREVKTPRTVCYEIMREIHREAFQFNPKEFRVLASQAVVDMFLEEESQHLAQLHDTIGKPITLQVQGMYTHELYDIVLL